MVRQGMTIGSMEFAVQNAMLNVGDAAPDFRLTANNWSPKRLNDYAGKVKIISVVPSLETRVCAAQTRRFNEEAAGLSEDVVVLTVSADLPYAQARWCSAEGIERVATLSDHKDMNFSDAYGVHVSDLRICQRAVFVVDKNDVVQLAEYVREMGDEVNFDGALAEARTLV
ncbi:MAG: thiol peroxidase [Chloroflexota bacterium]|nr:thiol peroxidase [Chloroflexota bacterium]